MKLFHYSGQKLAVLVPQIGDTRHKGEDEQAIDQPVVWLTDGDSDVTYDKDGNVSSIYQHEVEIDLNDPQLFLDQKKEILDMGMLKATGNRGSKWYFYKDKLKVIKVQKWNDKTNKYEA